MSQMVPRQVFDGLLEGPITCETLQPLLDVPFREFPRMTRLLLARSLAARVPGNSDLSVVAGHQCLRAALRWISSQEQIIEDGWAPYGIGLRPLRQGDLPVLYESWCDPDLGASWVAWGSTPGWEEFARHLWEGVDCAFGVESLQTNTLMGIVVSYAYNAIAGTTVVGILRVNALGGREPASTLVGWFEFMRKLFADRPIRKIVHELPEYNPSLWDGVGHRSSSPALTEHVFFQGQWWDVWFCELTRARYQELRALDDIPTLELLAL